jgi:flagellar hook-basal body complex protein FliE
MGQKKTVSEAFEALTTLAETSREIIENPVKNKEALTATVNCLASACIVSIDIARAAYTQAGARGMVTRALSLIENGDELSTAHANKMIEDAMEVASDANTASEKALIRLFTAIKVDGFCTDN